MPDITLLPFELPFKHPFTISRKSKTVQPLLVVKLMDEGDYGLGETADNSYYHMTVPRLMADLERIRPLLRKTAFTHPEDLWQVLRIPLKDNPFALCAVDQAAWDLYAKKQGKKLYEVWGLSIDKNPLTDYTIGIDSIDNMVQKIKEFPWPVYKIKLGTPDDIAIVKALRKQTDAVFRVDANCAWGLEETLENALALKALGVEFIEQPMADPVGDPAGWRQLRTAFQQSALPLIADENCIAESDVDRCYGYFHGVNIKLTKCGGLTPALRMIRKARELGMQLMIGSMNESTVGSSAAAHLLPYLDYVDMDGPLLLAKDTASGITFDHGKIIYADKPGTGAALLAASGH